MVSTLTQPRFSRLISVEARCLRKTVASQSDAPARCYGEHDFSKLHHFKAPAGGRKASYSLPSHVQPSGLKGSSCNKLALLCSGFPFRGSTTAEPPSIKDTCHRKIGAYKLACYCIGTLYAYLTSTSCEHRAEAQRLERHAACQPACCH